MAAEKTTADVISWLKDVIAPRVKGRLEVIPHGGTALALRGLKGGTKDVDLNVTDRAWFDGFCRMLDSLSYRKEMDLSSAAGHHIRYVSDRYAVDVVDVHYPTWNNWSITEDIRRSADILRFGGLTVVVPDRDALFLFKTYPCRPVDISDLDALLTKESPDVENVKRLFNDQEALLREVEDLDPVISIVNLRVRFYLSLSALRGRHKCIGGLHGFARRKLKSLGIGMDAGKLGALVGAPGIEWDRFIDRNNERFAKALGMPRALGGPRRRDERTRKAGRRR